MPRPPEPEEYEQFFYDNYNTQLDAEQEAEYKSWATAQGREKDSHDYDMRGAWLESKTNPAFRQGANGHFPDKYKKPNHPTFSDQSVYHGTESPWGWNYEGGQWAGKTYRPSNRMFVRTHNPDQLKSYMDRFEKETVLLLPIN